MGLVLVEKVLNMKIPLKVWEKDTLGVIDPLYNMGKIYERAMVNVEVYREENDDIMYWVYHVIKLSWQWIWKAFRLYPLPNVPTLQALTEREKGNGFKLIILFFPT